MGKTYDRIDGRLQAFIEEQHMFFVATAPLSGDGHVNLSPKGLDAFEVLDPLRVAYVDLVGSGVETMAHLKENGRIVIMFCAFNGPPNIVRLHGHGRAFEPGTEGFEALAKRMPAFDAVRSIIEVEVTRISDSCGFGVPRLSFEGERDQLVIWAERKGREGLATYKRKHNATSLDGLVGVEALDPSPTKR